jgi:hypothetical protein
MIHGTRYFDHSRHDRWLFDQWFEAVQDAQIVAYSQLF